MIAFCSNTESEDVRNISDLLLKCGEKSQIPEVSLYVYLWDADREMHTGDETMPVVLPYEERECVPKNIKTVTYSDTDSRADLSALNVQRRESALCFEILGTASMSRVFIPYTKKYTVQQVLVCASVLYARGVPVKQAVSLINETLK